MSEEHNPAVCVRCRQPIVPGQYKVRVEYTPVDIADLLRQPDIPPGEAAWLSTWSPYWMHAVCPDGEAA